jgi:hypothetical protein
MSQNNSNNNSPHDPTEHQGILESLGLPPPGELLPLGYLYLLILGITSESIHYGMLGVNVLDYSNALDVLLSPVALMTGNLAVLAVVVIVPLFLWPYLLLVRKAAKRRPTEKNARFRETPIGRLWLPMCAMALIAAFLGLGIGQGFAKREDLQAGQLEANTRLIFGDDEIVDAYVIGINSGYVFYVEPEATEVTISPIADNIQSLRALPDED